MLKNNKLQLKNDVDDIKDQIKKTPKEKKYWDEKTLSIQKR